MTQVITRHECGKRMSKAVIHGGVVYLAGVVSLDRQNDIRLQTADVLSQVDSYLAAVDSTKELVLSAQIWLKNIERDFSGMNEVWDAWIAKGHAPARATCQAQLGSPEMLVEIIITAAVETTKKITNPMLFFHT